jgi:geranylgeranyl diphosphate synthase type II
MHTTLTALDSTTAKTLVDSYLAEYSKTRQQDAEIIGASYVRLWRSIEKLLSSGGKRFRPYMVLGTYQAYAPDAPLNDVLAAAAAQELLHLAMLIHDDIIDRDTIRYGVQNITGQYLDFYATYIHDEEERSHMATAAAVLAGDALIADAHALLRKTNVSEGRLRRAEAIMTKAIFDVIGGELLDTEIAHLPKGSISTLDVARHKTASYSFVSPLTMGAVLAGAPEKDIALLTELAHHLGVGYQFRDDLLGVFGDEATTGKSASTDLTEGKRTYLIEQFEQLASEEQQSDFFAIFHRHDASDDELARAKILLIESGAKDAVEAAIDDHRSSAEQRIEQLSISTESRALYHELVKRCLTREA